MKILCGGPLKVRCDGLAKEFEELNYRMSPIDIKWDRRGKVWKTLACIMLGKACWLHESMRTDPL